MAADENDEWDIAESLSELFEASVSVDQVQQRELGDARLAVVNMQYRPTSQSTDGSSKRSWVKQTAVVLDDAELKLPRFMLAPSVTGVTAALLSALGGVGDIDFADSPEFSKLYYLQGWSEQPVRVLFTKKLRDHFAQHPGWSVHGNRSRLAIFKRKQLIDQDQTDSFLGEALAILAIMQEGEEELDARPDIRRETRPQDLAESAQRFGGAAGAMIQAQLRKLSVSKDELESFLNELPPRTVPVGIKRQVLGQNLPLVFIGGLFFVVGLIAGISILVFSEGFERLIGIPFLVMFPVVGGLMALLTIHHRRKFGRILRDGELVEGKITKLGRASASDDVTNQRGVTFAYQKNGQGVSASCDIGPMSDDFAQSLQDEGRVVRLLVDPKDRTQVVCPDLLMIL